MYIMRTMHDVRQTAIRCNNKFFNRESMRFFNTRLCESLTRVSPKDLSVWFVTSERPDDSVYGGRRYTVRRAQVTYHAVPWEARHDLNSWSWDNEYGDKAPDGMVWAMRFSIETVGEFMEHGTRQDAYKALVRGMLA